MLWAAGQTPPRGFKPPPREALSRLEVPPRPSPVAQGRSGNSSAELSQPPPRLPETRHPSSQTPPPTEVLSSESRRQLLARGERPSGPDPRPQPGCAAGVRRARCWGPQTRVPGEFAPGRSPETTSACPQPGHGPLTGLRPTHPARARASEDPSKPFSPAPALTHLFASPCRRARRCRVPLCTLRTQTNPPPALLRRQLRL